MPRTTVGGLLAACLLVGLPAPRPAVAADWQLDLAVTEPAGVERSAEPVSGGIPLPAATFKPGQAFALFDGQTPVPVQANPLLVDKDGFLRWVLVDFQANLGPNATRKFTLRPAAAAAAPQELRVTDAQDSLTIDTGKAKAVISKTKPFSLFDSVTANGKPALAGGTVSYTDGFSEKTFAAGPPEKVEIEYSGPLRVTVCVRGRFADEPANGLGYIARITAWAGQSRFLVKYSLVNSNPEHYVWRPIKDSRISLALAAPATGSVVGASKPLDAGPVASLTQGLTSEALKHARATNGAEEIWSPSAPGEAAIGYLAAKTAAGCVEVTDRFFAENPARQLALDGKALHLVGVMERFEGEGEKGKEKGLPHFAKRRLLCDSSHLTSEYVIDVAAPADAEALLAAARAAREDCWALAPADVYAYQALLPFGTFGTQADELAAYEVWGWKHDRKDLPTKFRCQWPYGGGYPRWFAGMDSHYDPEQDCVEQLLLMYMRTGSRFYFDNARSWANYHADLNDWRTDGWRFKDGGVWWNKGGPKGGNAPQRAEDPVTHLRNTLLAPWDANRVAAPMTVDLTNDLFYVADRKACFCHTFAAGMVDWYLLTGDRDALESAIDRVEQDYDFFSRSARFEAGKANSFVREYTRSTYNANAVRMVLPDDAFVRQASEYFVGVFKQRPVREPRGLVNAALPGKLDKLEEAFVGKQGLAALAESGNAFNVETGEIVDAKTGRKWFVNVNPHAWGLPPMSQAMELSWRLTGDEDALDWTIAYAQAAAQVLHQVHGQLCYGALLVDFPRRGVARDLAAWTLPPGDKYAEHMKVDGFHARFYPDVCARGYSLCGDPLLKQRAFEYWDAGSHRAYEAPKMNDLGAVSRWVNYYGDHDGQLDFVLRTMSIWGRPRKDDKPPQPVKELKVVVQGDKATVSFPAPADEGGGRVARYQVKCSDRPIVDYDAFLEAYADGRDDTVCNWWMATNLQGEPGAGVARAAAPGAAGAAQSFEVTGVPPGTKYFAVRSFDDSDNRSALGAVAEAGR